ncbi:hypothetical protein HU200_005046 [Digitaria exilis]|uniref:Uncharacterized protein n=1 Tax=Digitaria exilis TaxID=1010633 RepID=A0A835KWU1_9POAL|nr:hypothetical protein HU200_005046 [Digitaria exilis]
MLITHPPPQETSPVADHHAAVDWTALPPDIQFTIFLKLEPRGIIRGSASPSPLCLPPGVPERACNVDHKDEQRRRTMRKPSSPAYSPQKASHRPALRRTASHAIPHRLIRRAIPSWPRMVIRRHSEGSSRAAARQEFRTSMWSSRWKISRSTSDARPSAQSITAEQMAEGANGDRRSWLARTAASSGCCRMQRARGRLAGDAIGLMLVFDLVEEDSVVGDALRFVHLPPPSALPDGEPRSGKPGTEPHLHAAPQRGLLGGGAAPHVVNHQLAQDGSSAQSLYSGGCEASVWRRHGDGMEGEREADGIARDASLTHGTHLSSSSSSFLPPNLPPGCRPPGCRIGMLEVEFHCLLADYSAPIFMTHERAQQRHPGEGRRRRGPTTACHRCRWSRLAGGGRRAGGAARIAGRGRKHGNAGAGVPPDLAKILDPFPISSSTAMCTLHPHRANVHGRRRWGSDSGTSSAAAAYPASHPSTADYPRRDCSAKVACPVNGTACPTMAAQPPAWQPARRAIPRGSILIN